MATMFPGIDSEELRKLLAQYQATPEDKRQALGMGLLSGGLALAGARRGQEFNALAQAGLLGVGNYRGALQDASQSKLDAMKGAMGSLQLQQALQAARDDAGVRDALGGMQAAPSPAAGMPSLAPTVANASALQQRTTAAGDPFTRYMQYADQLDAAAVAQKNPKLSQMAEQYREKALKFRDENQGFETIMQNGQPTIVQRKKYGAPETLPGMLPKPEYKEVSTGDQKFFYDPLLNQKAGSFAMQMTPGEVASNKVALGNLGVAQAHLKIAQDKASQDKGEQFGTPIQVTAADGSTALYAPQKGTSNLVPMTGPDGNPLVKSASIPQAYKDKSYSLANLRDSLQEYKDAVSKYNTADYLNPNKATEVNAKFTAMQMGLKNLYELGALAGPDIAILERQMTNPVSPQGMFSSREMLKTQVGVVETMLKKAEQNLAKSYGQKSAGDQQQSKQVVRRGTAPNGKRVVQYSDGSIAEE